MVISMFLAHLVGDYILQWDKLALWKSRELRGVLVHGLVVFIVTWMFAMPFNPDWWAGVAFIGAAHILIDAFQVIVKLSIPPLVRFTLDQIAHILVITLALAWGGYLEISALSADLLHTIHDERVLAYLLGYAFVTMPTWVLVKFLAYGLVKGSPPDFASETSKYIGILERLLITTFVALGQFLLVPLVAVPRLVIDWPRVSGTDRTSVYLVELLAGTGLAIAIGLAISTL